MARRLLVFAALVAGLLLVAPWASAPQAAIVFVQSCHANSGGGKSSSNSCTMTVTAGNLIVMMAGSNGGGVTGANNSGCGDNNSGSYTYATNDTTANGTKICFSMNHAAGSTQFTYTNAASDWSFVDVAEFSGMVTSSALDQATSHGTASPSANATTGTTSATTNANDVVVTLLNQNLQATMTCPAGFTQIDNVNTFNTDQSWATCYKVVAATGTQSGTYTTSSATYGADIAAFKGTLPPSGLLPWLAQD